MIARNALKAVDSETVLTAIFDNSGDADRNEGLQHEGIVGWVNGYEAHHETATTTIIKDFVLDLIARVKGTHRLDWLCAPAYEMLVFAF